jgi:hypothetical protein
MSGYSIAMNRAKAIALWSKLKESNHWPPAEWARQCVEIPCVVLIGGGTETFAVIDTLDLRMLDEDEFPSSHFVWSPREGGMNWRDLE